MAYLALYRKYRPTTFDKLIGQEHIVRTLANQIESGKIGHAYLFCGTRGTGKTSAAKIFSKAINCLSPVNGSPCGECEVCRALADPSNLDITEIDAASNNGVNEIRDLREKITYPPVSCRFKVYIIDEVHMLSSAAFNALLKTLEEPPRHAVFILATTESHKLPATILSRCMRFDFRLISAERIAALISDIFDDIGKKYDKEAVMRIAKAGEGSIRDALSVADICVSYSDGKLTYDDVLEVLGTSDADKINAFVESVLKGDAGAALISVAELASLGKSMGLLIKDATAALRDMLVIKTCKKPNDILCMPEDKLAALKAAADCANEARILRCIEIFSEAESSLRYTVHPRLLFETAAVKASKPETDWNIDALMSRLSAVEEKLSAGFVEPRATADNAATNTANNNTAATKTANNNTANKAVTRAVVAEEAPPEEEPPLFLDEAERAFERPVQRSVANGFAGRDAQEVMGVLTRGLRQNNELMLWAVLQGLKAELDGDTLIITGKNESDLKVLERSENMAAIKKQLEIFGNVGIKVRALNINKNTEKFDNDIDEIKKIFGEDIVIIK